ncbi:MAG: LysR family transcriptional regulator [Burkholderiaceae bacterium]|nr:LysR family transcriptional regulator [Burkholderiaceae bacterium]
MDLIRAMRVFCRVADEGSFAAASRSLDLAPAVVTRVVAELEEHLGARLMNRTTRRLALTEVGEDYLARSRQILADVDDAEALAQSSTAEPRGHLRVLCPPSLAVHQLAKHLPEFHRRHPLITIELHTPGPVEAVDEGYDLTLISNRGVLDGDFIARRLARTEVILCASPEYLDLRGRPAHPSDLVQHDTMLPPSSELARGITFVAGVHDGRPGDANGHETYTVVPHRPLLSTSHADTMYAGALHGLGIAGLPSFMIEDALLEHALERVLPAWRLFSLSIWAAMPSRKFLPARTRVFLDFLVEIFGGTERDPWLAAAGCETLPFDGCCDASARLPSRALAG